MVALGKNISLTRASIGIFILSTASLAFEISLTRFFSVAQFYHFAFMVVSIALIGYGASGSFLTIIPIHKHPEPEKWLSRFALGAGLSILVGYLYVNAVPFDSYTVFIDPAQIFILISHFIILAAPFFLSGVSIGLLISLSPENSGQIYAASMIGSGCGCIIALVLPSFIGLSGTILASSAISSLAAISQTYKPITYPGALKKRRYRFPNFLQDSFAPLISGLILFISMLLIIIPDDLIEVRLSEYKGLSASLKYPEARIITQQWNAYSRIDVVQSDGIRSLPGVSTMFDKIPPKQLGLFTDGDNLSPIIRRNESSDFAPFMPSAVAYLLRPQADTLLLEPGGGLEILIAVSMGAGNVTAVEGNNLVIQSAGEIYTNPQVETVGTIGRSYLQRNDKGFDIVIVGLSDTFHPIRSGEYSLSENYRYTLEAFKDGLNALNPDGILLASRWLQTPPSESLRLFATIIAALENLGLTPETNIAAFRGYNMATILAKKNPFTEAELDGIYDFLNTRNYDLIYSPIEQPALINTHNVMKEPIYWDSYTELISTGARENFFRDYPYRVEPTTDKKPFFGYYYKAEQLNQIISEIGKIWQPFGGAGILVFLVLLGISFLLSFLLIITPILFVNILNGHRKMSQQCIRIYDLIWMLYFLMLGFAYLLIEIPIIQYLILYLGNPAYAFSVVLFTLLSFSGVGSFFSNRIALKLVFPFLIILLLLIPFILPVLIDITLQFSLGARMLFTICFLAPVGFLMGIPLPSGIRLISRIKTNDLLVPWSWGVNGAASVISSILAAILAVSFGYDFVLFFGALAYFIAWIVLVILSNPRASVHSRLGGQT